MSQRLYKTYLFKDKDPIIDLLRTVIKQTGAEFGDIAVKSGVSENTIRRWFYGDTRRPQHASVVAVARAIGYDLKLVNVGSKVALHPAMMQRAHTRGR